ncbi:MAG: GAF domain-containing protein [Caldilineales bacterium]
MALAQPPVLEHEDASQLAETLATIDEIGRALVAAGDEGTATQPLLQQIADAARRIARGSTILVAWENAAGRGRPTRQVCSGDWPPGADTFDAPPESPAWTAIHQQRAVVADAAGSHASWWPLVAGEQLLGLLGIAPRSTGLLTESALTALSILANQAATALALAQGATRVNKDLTRTAEELQRLRRADLLISSRLKLEDTLDAILEMALEVTGAHYGIFRLVDAGSQKLVTAAVAGDDLGQPAVEALPINTTSIMGWAAKVRQPLLIPDLRANPWARVYYPLDRAIEMRSELAVPLIGASGRLEGVLNLESPAVGAFSQQDSQLLQSLATQAVIAIQEQRLLDALQEIVERLLSDPPQQVFDRLVQMACELLNVPVASIWVLAGDELELRATNSTARRGARLPLHASLTGACVLTGQPLAVDDLRLEERFHLHHLAVQHNWSGALIVPLQAGESGHASGAFSIYCTADDSRRFGAADWDKKVLMVLAHHAALAVVEAARRDALRASEEQRALAETFAAVGDIAANLLHRINNKIGTVPVRVEGIEDKCRPALQADPYLAHNLQEIERSASEAMAIMRESLYLLRPINARPVDLAEGLAEALASCDLPPAVEVRVYGIDGLPPVTAGLRRLALVFANLFENAAAAMEGRGIITVSGSRAGGWVEVRVQDSGPGVPPELHDRIFDLNFSGRKVHSGKLGFGLWWVKTLMARFGGSVAVESDGQHGATFILRLPLAAAESG